MKPLLMGKSSWKNSLSILRIRNRVTHMQITKISFERAAYRLGYWDMVGESTIYKAFKYFNPDTLEANIKENKVKMAKSKSSLLEEIKENKKRMNKDSS